jgi:beta-xylosidase
MAPLAANAPALNPVYDGYLADPFVWRHQSIYYAIGTGAREASGHTAEKIFPILRSDDFQTWHLIGDALIAPAPELGDMFWAPAVAFANGGFYLYYSVGQGDKGHQLRVAQSTTPEGPYRDSGHSLLDPTTNPFSIDPHPFRDQDGQWYLFYATDFLDSSPEVRAGTALMVRRLHDMTQLGKRGHMVLRAHCDWQRFQDSRSMYGSVWDWHTLEGPCVVLHENQYFCFYSGGRWENDTYGVDYGVAQNVLGRYRDVGCEKGPRVLKSRPGQLIGPGHNSWTMGPDGNDYLAFHAWNSSMTLRQMHIAKLDWTPEGPRALI